MQPKPISHIPSILTFFLLTLLVIAEKSTDLSSERSALLRLRTSIGGRTLLWNISASSNSCTWSGVECNELGSIIGLRLPGFSLSGEIPEGVFKNLSSLKTLSLRFNNLGGSIPSDISSLHELRGLYLNDNEFSGEIPEGFSGLSKLVRLSLANNNFSGVVPNGLSKLKRLKSLYLENNQLNGFLPELKLELAVFNVSNNELNGSIPVSLSKMPVSSFLGNKLCGKPLQICPGIAAGTGVLTGEERKKKKKGLSGGVIAGIVIGAVVTFAIILMIIVFVCGKKRRNKSDSITLPTIHKQPGIEILEKSLGDAENGGSNNGYSIPTTAATMTSNGDGALDGTNGGLASQKLVFFGNGIGGKLFDLEELLRASAEVLGKGTFGTAYKAVLEFGTMVAVKRLKDVSSSETEFKEKIEAVGAMDNENLVPLRAYYYSRDEKLLVYDYMPMGSLSAFLHGNKGAGKTPLNWEMRSSIALNIARGITYIHSQGPDTSHGNIKSSNILLTNSHEARVSDFGIAQLVGPSSTPTLTPTRANGYRAPEVTDPRKVSQKADVYSFGVLLLELLTGKAPMHALMNEEGVDLPRWVRSIVRDDWTSEVFDVELLRHQHAEEEMVQLLELAMDCAAQHPDSRPSMPEVTERVQAICGSSGLKDDIEAQPTLLDDGR